MEKLLICRICMISNVRMHCLINTNLQEIYEMLTSMPFETKDRRPIQVCYICFARLWNCYLLRTNCIRSEKLFTHELDNVKLEQFKNTNTFKIAHPIRLSTPLAALIKAKTDDYIKKEHLKINDDVQVKEESCEDQNVNLQCEKPECSTKDDFVLDCSRQAVKAENKLTCQIAELRLQDKIKLEYDRYKNNASIIFGDKIIQSINLKSDHNNSNEKPAKNICPKIVKVVLHRIQLHDIKENNKVKKTDGLKENPGNNNLYKLEPEMAFKQNIIDAKKIQVTHEDTIEEEKYLSKIQYKCEVCKKCFTTKDHLNNHIPTHTSKKPYEYHVCKKSYNENSKVTNHILNRSGENLYKCDICDKYLKYENNLRRHILLHTGVKSYKCDTCEKCFNRKANLANHILVHTGEKPYKCYICEKRYRNKSHLNTHIRKHTGVKPYTCNICKKSYGDKGHLRTHMRVHTGERPYKCHICGKSYIHQSHLKTHIQLHTGEKPFKCDICKKSFSQKKYISSHIRVHIGKTI